MRVEEHPVLGAAPRGKPVTLLVDGAPVVAFEGEPIAAALTAAGYRVFRRTARWHRPRGLFCGLGRCTDCAMMVNGQPNIRTCVTPVEEGMVIETQVGVGRWAELAED
jgi:hypothetical protein